ncbi:MAG: acyltransferase domain-containing protein [Anaerolineae bacterium]|nr:acyltransferase domain-containing protein [Anaerolineae bacterium]
MARTKPVIFMFSGQGSHYYQMGRELYEKQPYFRAWMEKGDRLLQERVGVSVLAELYNPAHKKSDPFNRTRLSHPAIFLVEYSLAQALIEQGLEPDYVLGASLGSFAALAVAGALTFEAALLAVIEQADCLERYCRPGGMTAILADPALYEQRPWLWQQSTLAGINFDSHFVISTNREKLDAILQMLQREKITAQDLPVSLAFHSAEIDSAKPAYCDFLQSLPRQAPRRLFFCCAAATERVDIPNDYLWTVVREPIRFRQTIAMIEARQAWSYLDLGPSGTLATFVKYNLAKHSASEVFSIMTPFGRDVSNLNRLLRSAVGQ